MNMLIFPIVALTLAATGHAAAATYALSPDGLAVVRLVPPAPIAATTFSSSLLPSGYTSTTVTGGSLAIAKFGAGFKGGAGGGEIEGLFSLESTLEAGQRLEWIQVGNNNDPLPGHSSPFLDSSAATLPFYGFTAANRDPALSANRINFYDFSRRSVEHLASINPINWNADLYPVVVDAMNNIQVHDGVSWGWTMTKAPVGTTSATFTNAAPSGATVTGIGKDTFTWGRGDPSSLSFAGTSFDATPGTKFKIGTLTFRNGVTAVGSEATSVDFVAPLNFTNIPELDFVFRTTFTLVNTLNVQGAPEANADIVTIGAFGYSFNVLEGATASVDIMATLDTKLVGTPGVTSANYSEFDPSPFDASPIFSIGTVSLANVIGGGFITRIPEPSTRLLLLSGIALIALRLQKRIV